MAQNNPELDKQIVEIIDNIEDNYIFESLYEKALAYLYTFDNQEIRQDRRILCMEARLLISDDPSRSEQLFSEIFENDPLFFKNTFEYLTLLFDSYEGKAQELQKKLQQILVNYDGDKVNDSYYLACQSLAVKSKKDMKQSRLLMQQAINVASKPYQKSDMYSQLGNTYLEVDDFKNAIKYYNEGIKIQPKNDECLNNISFCYLEMHELEKSIEYGERALLNYPFNSTVLCNLAIVYEEMGDIDKAEEAYIKLFKNKSIGSVQHANYAQFLYEHRFDNSLKRLLIIENLRKGFIYDPTRENSIFETLYLQLRHPENFAKMMYSYQPLMKMIEFIETIRLHAPQILHKLGIKILVIQKKLEEEEANEEFEDVSDDEEEEDDDDNEDDQNQGEGSNQMEDENVLDQEQPGLAQLKSLDQNDNNDKLGQQEQEMVQQKDQIILHEPYLDLSLKKEITIHQKVLLYTLVYDLIELKMRENSVISTLIIYNKFVSENLHFQSNIQFWDLYFD